MKPDLKTILVCFIAAPLAAIGLWAAADSAGLSPAEQGSQFDDPQSRGRGEGPPERGHPMLRLLDGDGDGVLSAVEIQAMPRVMLAFDDNGDGALDENELHAAMPPPPPPPREGRGGRMGPPPEGRGDRVPGGFPFRGGEGN